MEYLLPMSWVLVPLAAIGLAVFQTWVRFQARQRTLGTTTKEMEHTIALLKAELEAEQRDRNTLLRRIEHLEAIVTSQVWDVVHDPAHQGPERAQAVAEAQPFLKLPEEVSDAERAAQLAQRLRV